MPIMAKGKQRAQWPTVLYVKSVENGLIFQLMQRAQWPAASVLAKIKSPEFTVIAGKGYSETVLVAIVVITGLSYASFRV